MEDKYLAIHPTGKLTWEQIPRKKMLKRLHEIIGCDCVEQVRTVLHGIVIIVDESGKIKDPPQPHNELASQLYYGWLMGLDDIVGPAVLAALRPTEPYGELDWAPLDTEELIKLKSLGYNIPEMKNTDRGEEKNV